MQKKTKILTILIIVFLTITIFSCATKPEEPKVLEPTEEMSIQQMIIAGKGNEARELFQSKFDINAVNDEGDTALHAAAQVNNPDLISFLLYQGADPTLKNFRGETPLHVAIKNDSRDAARILASEGNTLFMKNSDNIMALDLGLSKDPEYIDILVTDKTGKMLDENGRNIVHYMVIAENLAGVETCIKRMLPLSIADAEGKTPLHLAYEKSQSLTSVKIAAALILANATPLRGNFSFFEDSVKTRNPSLRFVDGQTPLHFAARMREVGITQYLLERKASIKSKNIMGSTPLHEAVRYGDAKIVQLLLQAGADPNSQDSLGKTPFLLIIPEETRSEIYDLLLKAGGNPNAKDMYGDTALHVAVMSEMSIDILTKLTNAGADINERNKQGVTPLALSIDRKLNDHVKFFSDKKADIHAEDIEGNTPLSRTLGTEEEKQKTEMLKIIVTSDNISSRDSYGNSPLHIAITKKAAPTQLDYLLTLTSDIDARNKNGDSPIYLAVHNNCRTLGERLLAKNADVFSTNNENYSALRLAMTTGGEVQDWLLTSEVIKATDGIGNTPLHYAAEWKLDNSVAILLEKGAKPNTQNANGETALFSAVKVNSTSTISLLIQKGANKDARDFLGNTPLHSCVYRDARDAAKMLILSGADINGKNLAGQTPLSEAARQGLIAMVTLLLDNGADINAFDATGKTILMDSIQSGNIEIVSLLLKRGASPLMQEMYGRNAYHEAASTGNIQLINMVRTAGGNPLARDAHGVTPFSLVMDRSDGIIKAVLGDDPRLVDSDGNTPLHIATGNKIDAKKLSMLVAQKYPINGRNRDGITPLGLAVNASLIEQTAVLLENGADPFIVDNSGECALSLAIKKHTSILSSIVKAAGNRVDMAGDGILHYAARLADEETVKQLLSMGLDKSIRNITGETPYDMAIRWQRPNIADLLK